MARLGNISIGHKLGYGIGAMLLLVIVPNVVAISNTNRLSRGPLKIAFLLDCGVAVLSAMLINLLC